MSEIKHTFQAGRMNKDLDERLVPNGEYRDALNIEVRTSGDSDAGVAQMLYGNLERNAVSTVNATVNWKGQKSVFVGSVTDEKNNKAYFFVASPPVYLPFVGGGEEIANGEFTSDADTGWDLGDHNDSWTITSDAVVSDASIGVDFLTYTSFTPTVGKTYRVSFEITSRTSGDIWLSFGDTFGVDATHGDTYKASAVGTFTYYITVNSMDFDGEDDPDRGKLQIYPSGVESSADFVGTLDNFSVEEVKTRVFKDMIIEYNATTKDIKPVVNDIFEIHAYNIGGTTEDGTTEYSSITFSDTSGIRPGMEITALNGSGLSLISTNDDYSNLPINPVVNKVNGNVVHLDRVLSVNLTTVNQWVFKAPKVLNFTRLNVHTNKLITGVNIIDNLLFWTDDFSEPKKINIDRCKFGTFNFSDHTTLVIKNPNNPNGWVRVSDIDSDNYGDLKEEHITVIRRAPRTSPKLEMASSKRGGDTSGNCTQKFTYPSDVTVLSSGGGAYDYEMASAGDPLPVGHIVSGVEIVGITPGLDYVEGDFLNLSNDTVVGDPISIRVKVESLNRSTYSYSLEIQSIDTSVTSSHESWDIELEQSKPLFELNLGRFSYRYKYQDGEYSSFAPWSELAFLPGEFDYAPVKGYNLGMVNTVRDLKVTDFVVEDQLRPDDTTAVDIIYKDTVSPNVYIVKTITRGIDSEWNESGTGGNSGVLNITSDMIHMALPSSQLLRAWDNVPRLAKAQEVTGNRLLYANYLQNYNVHQPVTVKQQLVIKDHADNFLPEKSIKSIRKYKIGVVYGDKYGRETTVLGMGGTRRTSWPETVIDSNVSIEKVNAHKSTKLSAQQDWVTDTQSWIPSDWMEYFKYYVKETTNEYYNLSMDRWYNAEDGNIWLSFQSADRNKLDEDTYIILKNGHGNNDPVLDEARYKILAIKNEAPDYIKITQKIIGDLPLSSDLNALDSGLVNSMHVGFDGTLWPTAFSGLKFKGIGYARIKGDDGADISYSKWVKISRINDNQRTINTIEQFGEAADMSSILSGTIIYSLQVKDDVVENRPEFDGRFFVKIFKDSILAENVLLETGSDLVYNRVDSFQHMYLNNLDGGGTHPSTSGTEKDHVWTVRGDITPGNANRLGECTYRTKTKDFWRSWGSNGPSGVGWFLDRSKVRINGGRFKNHAGLYNTDAMESNIAGLNAMVFSIRKSNNGSSGTQRDFRTKMSTTGNLFRFSEDPNEKVYKIVGSQLASEEQSNYTKGINNCDRCTADPSCSRRSFYVYFHQVSDPTKGVIISDFDPRGELKHDGTSTAQIDIVEPQYTYEQDLRFVEGNAIWETEPKEDVGLELYYEATDALPLYLKHENCESFAPKLSEIICERPGEGTVIIAIKPVVHSIVRDVVGIKDETSSDVYPFRVLIGDKLRFKHTNGLVTESEVVDHWATFDDINDDYKPSKSFTLSTVFDGDDTPTVAVTTGFNTSSGTVWEVSSETLTIPNATFVTDITNTTITLNNAISVSATHYCTFREVTGYYKLDDELYKYRTDLPWFNCYSFGNGLESDRIRDDYNAPTIDNGVKVSTTLENYKEERRGSGLIYSGIYNSTSGVNSLNEFNMAEAITKDLNPSYGSIQALKSRDTNLVTFCEDKVLQILANKDALYNADGNINVTASNSVLGDAKGFVGDYGISSNPESLAVDGYRMYFADKQRGKVMRLSQDGLTPISDIGMTTWFRENLKTTHELVGTFDEIKGEYNLSLRHTPDWIYHLQSHPDGGVVIKDYDTPTTVSFSEKSKGWSSFKSFIPQVGLSINDEYITGLDGSLWSHHAESVDANKFYGENYSSTIDILFNDNPSSIKSFGSINYEGSQSKVKKISDNSSSNPDFLHHLTSKDGWEVTSFETDKQEGLVDDFRDKEGKWFNYIKGVETTLSNLDTSEFSVQGLGTAVITGVTIDNVSESPTEGLPIPTEFTLTIENE